MAVPAIPRTSETPCIGGRPLLVSVVIPTYRREAVLVATLDHLLGLDPAPAEIIVVDQTIRHSPKTDRALGLLNDGGKIHWIRLARPSITHAMNEGLRHARSEVVLFLDDDILPGDQLIREHALAQSQYDVVAGQVLQPGEQPTTGRNNGATFRFSSAEPALVRELMGGNFSIKRGVALEIGGFDENFVHVAYRFEADFASRALAAGHAIFFQPLAGIRHLKSDEGGTRSFGHHLRTFKPSHAVGEYYFLLRSTATPRRWLKMLARPFRAIRTKHHLRHPWWIVPTLLAETGGFAWALLLALRGPRLLSAGRGDMEGE